MLVVKMDPLVLVSVIAVHGVVAGSGRPMVAYNARQVVHCPTRIGPCFRHVPSHIQSFHWKFNMPIVLHPQIANEPPPFKVEAKDLGKF